MEKKKYYKKIFGYFKNEKGLIFVYILTAILAVIINTLLQPYLLKPWLP